MTRSEARRAALVASLIAALASFALWYLGNRPVKVAGEWAAQRLASVSLAPFHRGQSPMSHRFPSPEQIEADLAILKDRTAGVRTYSTTEGLEAVPRFAGKYDIKVTHGAWLSSDLKRNEVEVKELIDQAGRYPDTIARVIVGNEVLLRGELTADQIAGYLRQVRQAIKQPVSYADVWEYWLRNPKLAEEVDYITVHFLPYWEDDPVDVAGSMTHIAKVYQRVRQAFPNKPILIGEVGWPSSGRAREAAAPGRVMEARFLSGFTRTAAELGLDYNIVEAFDQPWKTALEGTVGGNWGIVDAQRRPKFSSDGWVTERPLWWLGWAGGAALGIGAAVLAAGSAPGWAAIAALAVLGQALGAMLAISARFGVAQWYDKSILGEPLFQFALQAILAGLLLAETARRLASPRSPVSFAGPSSVLRHPGDTFWRDRLMLVFLLYAGLQVWRLALRPDLPSMGPAMLLLPLGPRNFIYDLLNGRYRDFPLPAFLVPILGSGLMILALTLFGRFPRVTKAAWPRLDLALVALLIAPALLLQWVENFANREAAVWGMLTVAFAALPLVAVVLGRATAPGAATAPPPEPAPLGPAGTNTTEVARGPGGRVLILDTITKLTPGDAGAYVVSGSHGGLVAAGFAVDVKPAAVFFNDAGVGKDDAGIAGLALLQQCGIAAGAVAHTSARIGDSADTWENGVITQVNPLAAALGFKPGQRLRDELTRLVAG